MLFTKHSTKVITLTIAAQAMLGIISVSINLIQEDSTYHVMMGINECLTAFKDVYINGQLDIDVCPVASFLGHIYKITC